MQVEELFDLCQWISRNVSENGLEQKFTALQSKLTNNANQGPAGQPMESERDDLVEQLHSINLLELSIEQVDLLKHLNILTYLGPKGVSFVEETLFKNALDIATARDHFNKALNNIKETTAWAAATRKALSRIINEENVQIPDGKIIVRVHFDKKSSINNIVDFKNWGRKWHDIGRGVAFACDEAPENVEVIGASRGSVIVILCSTYFVVKVLNLIAREVMKSFQEYYKIQMIKEEVKKLSLDNNKAERALDADSKEYKNNSIAEILNKSITHLSLDADTDNEKITSLKSSIKQLYGFWKMGAT